MESSTAPQRLSVLLTRVRTEREPTQRGLAKRAKVTEGYVSELEVGKRKNPALTVLKRLAKAPRRAGLGAPRVKRRSAMRKPLQRAAGRRQPEQVTTNQIMAWLAERLAQDPQLRRSIERVLTALRKAEAPALARRRRAR